MKRLSLALAFVAAICTASAAPALVSAGNPSPSTNIVYHLRTSEQAEARRQRIAAWHEKWRNMTPQEREAHRAAQIRRHAERAAQDGARREVSREQLNDGTIRVIRADGTVDEHRIMEDAH